MPALGARVRAHEGQVLAALGQTQRGCRRLMLAGTYLSLRAAELAARGLRDSQDQRRRRSWSMCTIADGS